MSASSAYGTRDVAVSSLGPAATEEMAAIFLPRPGTDAARRSFDIAVTLLLLPFVLVVGAFVAAAVVLDSHGSVLYRQRRVGRGGELFWMYKFRKMHHRAEGGLLTIAEDERFTPIGSLLALTKLDELPQLWNVLRGDMHLVGPRPEVPEFVATYRDSYDPILTVRPGITGPAAIEYASEAHLLAAQTDPLSYYAEQLMPRKISIDTAYVRDRTLLGDIGYVVKTLSIPLRRIVGRARRSSGDSSMRHAALVGTTLTLALTFVVASFA